MAAAQGKGDVKLEPDELRALARWEFMSKYPRKPIDPCQKAPSSSIVVAQDSDGSGKSNADLYIDTLDTLIHLLGLHKALSQFRMCAEIRINLFLFATQLIFCSFLLTAIIGYILLQKEIATQP
jgi:hypothetical protein